MNNPSIIRIKKAMWFSLAGIKAVFKSEQAFRQELALCAVALPFALFSHVTPAERALLIGSLFLILIIELVNSAIETIINRISIDIHPLSGRAKDIGSASVLLALVNAGIIWIIIFLG